MANVTGTVGGSRDFEITAGGTLIYSKQQMGAFPNADAVSFVISLCYC